MSDPSDAITLERHPPERARRGSPMVVACGGCCCCCCCCLHAVGGLAGAVVGSVPGPQLKGLLGVAIYWPVLVVLTFLTFVISGAIYEELLAGVLVVGLGLPALQLVAAIVSMVAVAIFERPKERSASIVRVALIMGIGFAGAVGGTAIMAVVGVALGALS